MKAEDRKVTDRIDQLIREITDRDWLEAGMSQEELDQSRLITQQMNAALREGYSMDEVLQMFDCLPAKETSKQETRQAMYRAYRKKPRRTFPVCTRCGKRIRNSRQPSTL